MIRLIACILLLLSSLSPAQAAKRVALVIGNSSYEYVAELPNPKNDAEAIAASLGRLGFEVIKGLDVDHAEFIQVIRKFSRAIRGADMALLFYAGHGLQVDGRNYLAPVKTQLLAKADLEFETIRLEMIMALMEDEPRTNLVFLDACRNNPLSRNLARSMGTRAAGIGRGLATIESGIGTLIAFATQPGNVALDGDTSHSPFTEALINHIETPGEDIAVLLRRVRSQVIKTTNGQQVPWSNSSLTGSVILKEKVKEKPKPDNSAEIAFWNSIEDSDEQSVFEAYLETYKRGIFSNLATTKIALIDRKRKEERKALKNKLEAESVAQAEREVLAERLKLEQSRREAAITAESLKQKALSEAVLAAERKISAQRKIQLEEANKARKSAEAARLAMELQLEELEKTKQVASQQQVLLQNNQQKLASLKQTAINAESEFSSENNDKPELVRLIQIELNRVGCTAGKPDGIWGKGSRKAARAFNKYGKIELVSLEPSVNFLDQLKAKSARICPLVCRSGFEKKNDSCIRIKREANLQKQTSPNKNRDNNSIGKREPVKNKVISTGKRTYMCLDYRTNDHHWHKWTKEQLLKNKAKFDWCKET